MIISFWWSKARKAVMVVGFVNRMQSLGSDNMHLYLSCPDTRGSKPLTIFHNFGDLSFHYPERVPSPKLRKAYTPTQLSRLLCTQFPNLRPGTTPLRHKYLGKSRDVGITDLILRNTSPSILARIYEKNRHHATHLRSSRSYSRWAGLGGLWYRYFQWTATWLWTGR